MLLLEELQLFKENGALSSGFQEGTATFLTIWDKNTGTEFSTGSTHSGYPLVLRTPKNKSSFTVVRIICGAFSVQLPISLTSECLNTTTLITQMTTEIELKLKNIN